MKAVMARSSYLDWSVVSDGYVAKALEALMTAERMADRWDGITPQELAIHRLVLLGFVRAGMPPTLNDLKMSTGQTLVDLRSSLRSLQRRDLVLFEDDVIVAAYPFSAAPTQHRVSLGGRRINAICVIDALGTAAMTGHETTVQSACPECERQIKVSINRDGLEVEAVHPEATVIWAEVSDVNGCAAKTQCQSMLAFCCDEHLEEWKRGKPAGTGFRLTPEKATQIGAAVFLLFVHSTDRPIELSPTS